MYPPRRVRDLNQVLTLGLELKRGVSFPNPTHAGCNSEKRAVLQNSSTPSLRSHEIEDDDEDSLSDVAFCAHWLAVLSASEVGRTKRLTLPRRTYRPCQPGSRLPRVTPKCTCGLEAVAALAGPLAPT